MDQATCNAQIQNIFSAFVHALNEGNIEHVRGLLTEGVSLKVPELKLSAIGPDGFCTGLQHALNEKKAEGIRDYHIPHNLCSRIAEDGKSGQVYAETHSFRTDVQQHSAALFCTRFDMDLVQEEGTWRIGSLKWYALQFFQPMAGEAGGLKIWDSTGSTGSTESAEGRRLAYDSKSLHSITGKDHIEIQNLLGRYCIWNREGAADLFAGREDAQLQIPGLIEMIPPRDAMTVRMENAAGTGNNLDPETKEAVEQIEWSDGLAEIKDQLMSLKQSEQTNQGCYLAIPYLGAPVIVVNGEEAQGWWMSHTYTLRSALFGKEGQEDCICRIERVHGRFVKEQGVWKILTLEFWPMAQLPPRQMDWGIHGQVSLKDGNDHWPTPPEFAENFAPQHAQEVYELERIFPEWGLRLRRAEMQLTPELIFISDQDRVDIDIHVRRNIGIANNLFRLKEFDDNCRPHQTTSHNTSTPYFYVNEAGDRAEISWFDESWTNMNAVFKREDEPVQFMLNVAEYRFTFEKEADKGWKVQRIWWRVIYRLPDLTMDLQEPCFCNNDQGHLWPMPFDTLEGYDTLV